jgi:hypothetical protein
MIGALRDSAWRRVAYRWAWTPARWLPRAPERRAPQSTARLIHVASLNRVKDQHTLLRALECLALGGVDFHLDIVGEDTLTGETQRLCAELHLEQRVTFHGFLPQAELRALMARAHVCVMSSRHEAGPLAMLEAATLGVPTGAHAWGHRQWAPTRRWQCGGRAGIPRARSPAVGDEELRCAGRAGARRTERRLHGARSNPSINKLPGSSPGRRWRGRNA